MTGSHALSLTLEDVLYITGLPITGEPVLNKNAFDDGAFNRVFGRGRFLRKTKLPVKEIMNIALNKGHVEDYQARKIAVLLIVLFAFIAPNNNKHEIHSVLVQFVENLDRINDYAWGAALLAYLYYGMRRYKDKKKYIDGNLWVLLVSFAYTFIVLFYCDFFVIYLFLYLSVFLCLTGFFFIIRIKKLQTALGIKLKNPPESVKHG